MSKQPTKSDKPEKSENGQTPKFNVTSIDFSQLSLKQLQELQERAAQAAETAREQKRIDLRVKIEALLTDNGFSLQELFPSEFKRAATSRRGAAMIQYRNPGDPSQTWTGRGRTPRWLQAKIDEGMDREDFRIRGSSPQGGSADRASDSERDETESAEQAAA